jgi:hypothetical protein
MLNQEEIESIKIVGPCKESNPFIEKMTKYFLSKKGNLYSFLKTLSDDDLSGLADSIETNNKHFKIISIHLSTMAHSFEQTQYGSEFNIDIEELIKINQAFTVMCALALEEKNGTVKVKDKSFFFVKDCPLTIELL